MEVEGRIFKAPETIEKHKLSSEKTLYFKYYGFWNFLKRRKKCPDIQGQWEGKGHRGRLIPLLFSVLSLYSWKIG